MSQPSESSPAGKKRIFAGVTAYHWLVLVIATSGWLFDCMSQRIFVLARASRPCTNCWAAASRMPS
jgi:hypothetical protein